MTFTHPSGTLIMTTALLGSQPEEVKVRWGVAVISVRDRRDSLDPHADIHMNTHTHTHMLSYKNSVPEELNQLLYHPLVIINNCFLIRAMPLANYLFTLMQLQQCLQLGLDVEDNRIIHLQKNKKQKTKKQFTENNMTTHK